MSRSAAAPFVYAVAMPLVSMVAPVAWATASPAARTNASPSGPSGRNTRPGLVQNCPAPSVSEPTYAVASCVDRTVGEGAGEHDDRVDRRHLGVDRDRLGTRGGRRGEREPATAGAGEADGLDPRVADQLLAELDTLTQHEGEDAGRQAGLLDGAGDGAGDQLAGARVGGVALDDDRAAGGQRGGGVAAGGGEREREVAGAEDGDRAERDHPLPQVGSRQGCAVGQRRVEAYAEVVAAAYDARRRGAAGRWCGRPRRRSGPRAGGSRRRPPRRARPCRPRSRRRRSSRKSARCSGLVAR